MLTTTSSSSSIKKNFQTDTEGNTGLHKLAATISQDSKRIDTVLSSLTNTNNPELARKYLSKPNIFQHSPIISAMRVANLPFLTKAAEIIKKLHIDDIWDLPIHGFNVLRNLVIHDKLTIQKLLTFLQELNTSITSVDNIKNLLFLAVEVNSFDLLEVFVQNNSWNPAIWEPKQDAVHLFLYAAEFVKDKSKAKQYIGLLQSKIDITHCDTRGRNVIIIAATYSNFPFLEAIAENTTLDQTAIWERQPILLGYISFVSRNDPSKLKQYIDFFSKYNIRLINIENIYMALDSLVEYDNFVFLKFFMKKKNLWPNINNIKLLEYIIKHKKDPQGYTDLFRKSKISLTSNDIKNSLIEAVKFNHLAYIKAAGEKKDLNPSVWEPEENNHYTLFHFVAIYRHTKSEIQMYLNSLQKKVDIRKCDKNGHNAATIALCNKNYDFLTVMIDSNNLNIWQQNIILPTIAINIKDESEIKKYLAFFRKNHIPIVSPDNVRDALHQAVKYGNISFVKMMLKKPTLTPSTLWEPKENGITLLHIVAEFIRDKDEILNWLNLLAEKIDIRKCNENGHNAATHALCHKNYDFLTVMINSNNVDIWQLNVILPVIAANIKDDSEIKKYLTFFQENNIPIVSPDIVQEVLRHAVRYSNIPFVKMMLKNSTLAPSIVWKPREDGITLLHIVAEFIRDKDEILILLDLLAEKIDIKKSDKFRNPILHAICYNNFNFLLLSKERKYLDNPAIWQNCNMNISLILVAQQIEDKSQIRQYFTLFQETNNPAINITDVGMAIAHALKYNKAAVPFLEACEEIKDLDQSAIWEQTKKKGYTFLHYTAEVVTDKACVNNALAFLLKRNIPLHVQCEDGSPLQIAAKKKNVAFLTYVLNSPGNSEVLNAANNQDDDTYQDIIKKTWTHTDKEALIKNIKNNTVRKKLISQLNTAETKAQDEKRTPLNAESSIIQSNEQSKPSLPAIVEPKVSSNSLTTTQPTSSAKKRKKKSKVNKKEVVAAKQAIPAEDKTPIKPQPVVNNTNPTPPSNKFHAVATPSTTSVLRSSPVQEAVTSSTADNIAPPISTSPIPEQETHFFYKKTMAMLLNHAIRKNNLSSNQAMKAQGGKQPSLNAEPIITQSKQPLPASSVPNPHAIKQPVASVPAKKTKENKSTRRSQQWLESKIRTHIDLATSANNVRVAAVPSITPELRISSAPVSIQHLPPVCPHNGFQAIPYQQPNYRHQLATYVDQLALQRIYYRHLLELYHITYAHELQQNRINYAHQQYMSIIANPFLYPVPTSAYQTYPYSSDLPSYQNSSPIPPYQAFCSNGNDLASEPNAIDNALTHWQRPTSSGSIVMNHSTMYKTSSQEENNEIQEATETVDASQAGNSITNQS